MWLWLTVLSALLLGTYDVAKKRALKRNGVYWILVTATGLTALYLSPFLFLRTGSLSDHLSLMLKAVLVSLSWVSGLKAMECLPLTTVSTIKASRPMFVVIFSIILFGERLNLLQWLGVAVVMTALFLSSRSKHHETDKKTSAKGITFMIVSVLSGSASALYDKHILQHLEPLFVQSWTNLFITVILALCVLVKRLAVSGRAGRASSDRLRPRSREWEGALPASSDKFRWDWTLVLVAVLITGADALYFFALNQPDALLSIISVVRRASVLVTFVLGAIIFHEGNIRAKGLNMLLMAAGVVLLLIGS